MFSVRCRDSHGNIQLSLRGHAVQEAAVLLRVHHLHPHLHDCLRLLDVLLAGPQVSPGSGDVDHHYPAGHVHHHSQHQQLPAPSGLHQGLHLKHETLSYNLVADNCEEVWMNIKDECMKECYLA